MLEEEKAREEDEHKREAHLKVLEKEKMASLISSVRTDDASRHHRKWCSVCKNCTPVPPLELTHLGTASQDAFCVTRVMPKTAEQEARELGECVRVWNVQCQEQHAAFTSYRLGDLSEASSISGMTARSSERDGMSTYRSCSRDCLSHGSFARDELDAADHGPAPVEISS